MLALVPVLSKKIEPSFPDAEFLRAAIMAELDTVHLFEQMMRLVYSKEVKQLLVHAVHEELAHVHKFMALLLKEHPHQLKKLTERAFEARLLPEPNESASVIALASTGKQWVSD